MSFNGVEVLEAQRISVDVLGHSVYCKERRDNPMKRRCRQHTKAPMRFKQSIR